MFRRGALCVKRDQYYAPSCHECIAIVIVLVRCSFYFSYNRLDKYTVIVVLNVPVCQPGTIRCVMLIISILQEPIYERA